MFDRSKGLVGFNLGMNVRNAARMFPKKEALIDAGKNKRYTYRELNDRVNSAANALLKIGVKKGEFIAVLAKNCSEFVELYYVAAKIGAIIAPLNYRLSPSELITLINYSDAKVLIFGEEYGGLANDLKEKICAEQFICIGSNASGRTVIYEDLATSYSNEEPDVEVSEHDYHNLRFTSGTTGLPKGYLLTQYMNSALLMLYHNALDYTSGDTVLVVFPLNGGVALAASAAAVYAKAQLVVMDYEPAKTLEVIEKEGVTLTNLVPTMAQMLLQHPNLKKHDLSSLRGIVFAGAPLPKSIMEGCWQHITPNVYEYYGLQETGILVAVTPEVKRQKAGSCGAPLPFVDLRIVDKNDNDVPAGNVGEVIARAPSTTAGYYKDEAKSKITFRNGWMHTGDLGQLDEDGYLTIVGRTKDMIITGGQNVFSVEVEETIFSHPKVLDCAVIGLPDEKWGEKVTAVIVPKPSVDIKDDEIIEYCNERIARLKVPKTIIFTDTIPRTPTGKAQKFLLVGKYAK
jgi:acyl-CoA synthetase (AMP-forming)/AMP-acid ligase II